MVLYRGLADDLALMDWLQKYIFPAEAKTVSPDFVRVGTRLAALEMIESGTTTFADMYYFEDDIAEATHEAGLRAVLGQSVIMFPVADAPTPDDGARARRGVHHEVEERSARHAGRRAARGLHARRPDAEGGARAGQPHGVPLLIHLAETQDEIKIDQRRAQHVAGAVPRSPRPLERPVAGRPRGLARRRGHGRCSRSAASAWRTTPRAT